MKCLVLLFCITSLFDGFQITIPNNALILEIMYNCIGIHSGNEPVSKAVEDFFSCTDKEEL